MTPKIYVFINGECGCGDVVGVALAEDGAVLVQHISSNYAWFCHDMGLTSDRHHDAYYSHYPDGYELVEVEDPKNHDGWKAAVRLHTAKVEEDTHADTR